MYLCESYNKIYISHADRIMESLGRCGGKHFENALIGSGIPRISWECIIHSVSYQSLEVLRQENWVSVMQKEIGNYVKVINDVSGCCHRTVLLTDLS